MKGTLYSKAKGLMDDGEILEAINLLEGAIKDAPENAELRYLLGNAYRKQSNWQKAIGCYNEAIRLDPDSPAVEARKMLNDILEYYCKDIYNP